jgi:subtilisin family serine protease
MEVKMKVIFLCLMCLQSARGAVIIQFKKGVKDFPAELSEFTQKHEIVLKPSWDSPRYVTQSISLSVWDQIKRQPNLAIRVANLKLDNLNLYLPNIEKIVEDREFISLKQDITPVSDPSLPCRNTIYIGGYSGEFHQDLKDNDDCDGFWLFPEEGTTYRAEVSDGRTLEIYEGGQLLHQGKGSLSFQFEVAGKNQLLVVRGSKGKYTVKWKPERHNDYFQKLELHELSNAFGYGSIESTKAYSNLTGNEASKTVLEKYQGAYMMNVGALWQNDIKGQGVRVGVIDTGVDFSHSFLKDCLESGVNISDPDSAPHDDEGHGTHVAGIIHQIAPLAKIVPIKVLDRFGSGSAREIAAGINWAIEQRLQVLNLSIGADLDDDEVFMALKRAQEQGILVALAAGNDSSSRPTFPARYTAVLPNLGFAVGALNNSRELALFSDRSGNDPKINYVAAFGTLVHSSALGGGYKKLSGTSMAAPQVSGLFALFKSLTPTHESKVLLNALKSSVQLTSMED